MEEFAASYALESLDADERAEFGEHIAVCDVCRSLTAEFGYISDAIPDTLEPAPASAALKQRLLTEVRSTLPDNVAATATAPDRPDPSQTFSEWLGSIFGRRYSAVAAAFAVIVIGGLLAWNLTLQFGGSEDEPDPPFASGQHLYNLTGTDASPGSSGAVFRVDENTGFLVLTDLPEPPPGHVYQVWRIKGEHALPENTFVSSGTATIVVTVSADVADADSIGVNIEPEGGNQVPTGEVLVIKQS